MTVASLLCMSWFCTNALCLERLGDFKRIYMQIFLSLQNFILMGSLKLPDIALDRRGIFIDLQLVIF